MWSVRANIVDPHDSSNFGISVYIQPPLGSIFGHAHSPNQSVNSLSDMPNVRVENRLWGLTTCSQNCLRMAVAAAGVAAVTEAIMEVPIVVLVASGWLPRSCLPWRCPHLARDRRPRFLLGVDRASHGVTGPLCAFRARVRA